ncbi:MAG TPA: metalloregulator ArsR/SmtB family transcription factor [Gemmatimonadales bacterium]|nr:metalloregulator ArsR/SmtB family transcription factor [Gemmatimonadales bacterium]
MSVTIVSRLQSLADATRNRLLLLLERHELTVGELCDALQLPQSTVSRHLKVLADDGWVVSRADGTSRLYQMANGELDPAARRLWLVVKDQAGATPAAQKDAGRLRSVLAERRQRAEEYFETAAGQWDRTRAELFGGRTELLPLLGLLDPSWIVGDLGCGTGQLALSVAPFVRQVIAVDASAAMLRSAKARVGHLEQVDIRRGQLEQLPIEDGDLDLACLALVLPYVPEPAVVIAEAGRTVKSGGRVLITDLQPHDHAEYRQTMGHQWLGFPEASIRSWMGAAGFTDIRYVPLPPEHSAKGPLLFSAVGRKR